MKTYRFIVILLGMLFIAGNVKADGGDVLESIVRLPKTKETVYILLGKISEQSGYLFIYDSRIINNDSIVKVRKKSCSVRQAIYEITGNKHLELKVLGNHILITQTVVEATGGRVAVPSSRPSSSVLTGVLLDKETGAPLSMPPSLYKEVPSAISPTGMASSDFICPIP